MAKEGSGRMQATGDMEEPVVRGRAMRALVVGLVEPAKELAVARKGPGRKKRRWMLFRPS